MSITTQATLPSYLAHELRAPLTSIHAALSLMVTRLDGRLNDDERRLLAMALRNSQRLDSLITDILDLGKLREGRLPMHCAPTPSGPLLAEAAESLGAWAALKNVRLVLPSLQEPMPRVLADGRRCVQALINILSNAIKFTPAGGRVELSALPGGRQHPGAVLFTVADTGPGIPAEDLERVFSCFEQSELGKSSQGTGLGLTLSRLMIEGQGGRIWAQSPPGRGATISFTLPAAPGDAPSRHGGFSRLCRHINTVMASLI